MVCEGELVFWGVFRRMHTLTHVHKLPPEVGAGDGIWAHSLFCFACCAPSCKVSHLTVYCLGMTLFLPCLLSKFREDMVFSFGCGNLFWVMVSIFFPSSQRVLGLQACTIRHLQSVFWYFLCCCGTLCRPGLERSSCLCLADAGFKGRRAPPCPACSFCCMALKDENTNVSATLLHPQHFNLYHSYWSLGGFVF